MKEPDAPDPHCPKATLVRPHLEAVFLVASIAAAFAALLLVPGDLAG